MTLDEKFELYNFLNENTCGEVLRSDIMNEEAGEDAAIKVLDKMLQLTIGRYNKMDFKEIEKSRGDVMECKFYRSLRESIDILCDIDMKTHNIPGAVIVSTGLSNLFNLKEDFVKAYREKNGLAILLYNTMYYSIIEETTYLMAASVDFASNGGKLELDAINANGRSDTLLSNIEKFNKEVGSGRVSKFINASKEVEKHASEMKIDEAALNEGLAEIFAGPIAHAGNIFGSIGRGIITALTMIPKPILLAAGIIAALIAIIPLIKGCIYLLFKLRHNVSEDLKLQAEIIEFNANSLEYKDGDNKVVAKQRKSAENFRRISRKFALDHDNAESDAKKDERNDNLNVNALVI